MDGVHYKVNDITFQPVTQNVILSGSFWIIDHFINPSEVDYLSFDFFECGGRRITAGENCSYFPAAGPYVLLFLVHSKLC
jgi:hypothetical protein